MALLNIGAEEEKGDTLRHEAHALLKEAGDAGRIRFVGNIEAGDAMLGGADVIVADGFSGNVMLKAMEGIASFLLRELKDIFYASGKNKLAALGGEVKCLIADDEVARMAKSEGITRSMAAMRTFGKELEGAIVAIGNAPTALYEVLRLVEEENILPAVIVGIPVGFVGAADSKELLAKNEKVPYITVEGTKGGSPIAAAAVNAMLYQLS